MANWQAVFDSLNLNDEINGVLALFERRKNHKASSSYSGLERSHNVCRVFASALEEANVNNTSLVVFQKAAAAIDGILKEIQKSTNNPADLDSINTHTDVLLECLPAISASNENPRLIHKKAADFETFVAENRGKISEVLSQFKSELGDMILKAQNDPELSKLLTEARAAGTETATILEKVKAIEIEGVKLAAIAAGKTLDGDYSKRASKEKWAGRIWTAGTFVFASLGIGTLLYLFKLHFDGALKGMEQNYQLIASQVLLTATLGLLAKWCSKRANVHVLEEARYHRLAVNMATVNSFIGELNAEAKGKVISALAISNFSDPTVLSEMSSEYETPITEILKTTIVKATDKK